MGGFAEILHMPPREVRELTAEEFEALAGYVEQRMKGG
jgi:hypothetical protein